MYRVQIEVAKHQSGRIHLERESYSKAEECRLFSSTRSIVATIEANTAAGRKTDWARTQASGKPAGGQWDMVRTVDGLPMESSASGLVWGVQYNPPSAFSGMAAKRCV